MFNCLIVLNDSVSKYLKFIHHYIIIILSLFNYNYLIINNKKKRLYKSYIDTILMDNKIHVTVRFVKI